MKTPQDRRWIWSRIPNVLDGEHDRSELQRLARREPDQRDTAAGIVLRLRQRLIPVCAREVDAASA